MIKLQSLLLERIDYLDTAKQLVKKYKLKSKVKFGKGENYGDYDWHKDIIYLDRSYPTMKEFFITVLHEIHHAKQRQKLGAKKYEKRYNQAGTVAQNQGKDFYDDNKYETRAENWAQDEYRRLLKQGELK